MSDMSEAVHVGIASFDDDRTPRQKELDKNRKLYGHLTPSEFLVSLHPEHFDYLENALKLIEVIAAKVAQKAMLGEEVTLTFNNQTTQISLRNDGRYEIDGFYYTTASGSELLRAIKLAMYCTIVSSAFHAEIDGKLAI
jgi:hypothetical protein